MKNFLKNGSVCQNSALEFQNNELVSQNNERRSQNDDLMSQNIKCPRSVLFWQKGAGRAQWSAGEKHLCYLKKKD